jgi:hypothetical protein
VNHKTSMKSLRLNREFGKSTCAVALSCLLGLGICSFGGAATAAAQRTFSTPEAAAVALIDAAEKFDVPALEQILGPGSKDIIHSGEPARDQERAKQFAQKAREKMQVSTDPTSKSRAFISVDI